MYIFKALCSIGQPNFPRIVRPIDQAPICLSLEEVSVCADHQVLLEVDDNSGLIVGDLKGILGQKLRPRPISNVLEP